MEEGGGLSGEIGECDRLSLILNIKVTLAIFLLQVWGDRIVRVRKDNQWTMIWRRVLRHDVG